MDIYGHALTAKDLDLIHIGIIGWHGGMEAGIVVAIMAIGLPCP